MITNNPSNETKFAAIYNAGFPSPEDNFYCETLQELRDELKERDDPVLIAGEEITCSYQCSIFIRDNWVGLSIENVFGTDDFYSEEQWAKILGL